MVLRIGLRDRLEAEALVVTYAAGVENRMEKGDIRFLPSGTARGDEAVDMERRECPLFRSIAETI